MIVLGVETSCDDTSVGIWNDGRCLANIIYTQEIHAKWGGVIPELASRNHIITIIPTIKCALKEAELELDNIDGIAACAGPGLLGSLLVGLCTAKSIAWSKGIPFFGVHHLEGHIFGGLHNSKIETPFIALVVSGGHSHIYLIEELGKYRLLGKTRDDAAGEAFDKGAKAMGLGFPGGPEIDKKARNGDKKAFKFPRAMCRKGELDLSFSGLKTSLLNTLEEISEHELENVIEDLAASYQEAIIDTLTWKVREAVNTSGVNRIVVAGGVSANKRLRDKLGRMAQSSGWQVIFPNNRLSTDNGFMIASAGAFRLKNDKPSPWDITARSRWLLEDL